MTDAERRQLQSYLSRFENDLDLAVVVLGVLTARVLHLPVPAELPLIAAIAVKRGLDALCGCV